MYSAVDVQEVLQRWWEPWRWWTEWPAIRSSQWQIERIMEADPLITTGEVDEHWPSYSHLAFEANWKGKKLNKWGCLMSWHQIKKTVEVWPSLILCNNNEPFFDQFVMCNEKRILYDNRQKPAQWLLLLSHWLQSCPTLCDPIDGSPPGSLVPWILQARTLEWVAISFSYAWKWKVKGKSLSRVRLFTTPWTAAHQAPPSMGFSRQKYWSGVLELTTCLKTLVHWSCAILTTIKWSQCCTWITCI